MSLLSKRALHRWPEDRSHLRVVILVLNSIQGMDEDTRFLICERYVVTGTIIIGRKVLQQEGKRALELLIERFVHEVLPSIKPELRPSQGERAFFLLRWFRACVRSFG